MVDPVETVGAISDESPPPEGSFEPKVIRGWADGMKARMDNVNALAVVATFLAAVQAQLISFTYLSNSTDLQKAVNTISFLGLSFDIIGTATGLISALTMQPDQLRLNQAVFEATTAHAEWRSFSRELEQIAILDKGPGRSVPQHLQEELARKQRDRWERQHFLELRKMKWIEEDRGRTREVEYVRRALVVGNIKGMAPLCLMGMGIVCFFASLIAFTVDTQPTVVWAVLVASVCGGCLILPVDAFLHSRTMGKLHRRLNSEPEEGEEKTEEDEKKEEKKAELESVKTE